MRIKNKIILMLVLLSVGLQTQGFCESRGIGVRVDTKDSKLKVSIFSDVKEENRSNMSIAEAASILERAQGWGSIVWVGIIAHGIPAQEYLPIIKAISKNAWLELVFLEGAEPSFIFDNIKKRMDVGK